LVVVFSGCGGNGSGGSSVTIHGTVQNKHITAFSCAQLLQISQYNPKYGSSPTPRTYELTFKDAAGKIIGTTTTSTAPYLPTQGVGNTCDFIAQDPYSITLPKETFYQAEVVGVSGTIRISYGDLMTNGFAWNLDAGSF
jgi:hypothetical protein